MVLDFTQCSHNWPCRWYYLSNVLMVHHTREYTHIYFATLCGGNLTRASDVSSKYVTIIHCTTTLGHPCLVSLLFIPSLYSPFFNSKNFFIYLLCWTEAYTTVRLNLQPASQSHWQVDVDTFCTLYNTESTFQHITQLVYTQSNIEEYVQCAHVLNFQKY